jgi:hypothetical protein
VILARKQNYITVTIKYIFFRVLEKYESQQ